MVGPTMLAGEKIRLVPLEEKHLDDIMKEWNSPKLRKYLGGFIPHSREVEHEWIQSAMEEMKQRKSFIFVVERISDDSFIGTIALHDIDWLSRNCTLGIALHSEENWGKGYGSEAIKLLIDFAWQSLNLYRIELSVYDFNARAKHVYEKIGFVEFGIAHRKYYIDGKYVDTHYMELLRDNY